MAGAMRKFKEIIKKKKNVWLPRQFENKDNIKAHELGIGKEILKETKGKVDVFGGEAICPYCGASIPYHVRVGRPKYQNFNV